MNDVAMSGREDWPFGPELRRRREALELSVREAARRTNKRVSEGRWRQLEDGVSRTHGQEFPINTKPATVRAAAKVVDWDQDEALRTAGFNPGEFEPENEIRESTAAILRSVADDELVREVAARLARARHALQSDGLTRHLEVADSTTLLDAIGDTSETGEDPGMGRREHG